MKLAIMQPYFFPYIGYWQLMQAADRFIVLDDVSYRVGGWINRNRVLINGKATFITVPVSGASQNRSISEICLDSTRQWRRRLSRTVEQSYARAPCFAEIFPIVDKLIRLEAEGLSGYLALQLAGLAQFMDLPTQYFEASKRYANSELRGQERIVDICHQEGATTYINLPGGRAIYDREAFKDAGIDLTFIEPHPKPSLQRAAVFIPNLSVIAVLMGVGRAGIFEHLRSFRLHGGRQGQ